jgi:enoyl-CoA hydratase/carnithine racemase
MTSKVLIESRGPVLTIGINRPEKANAVDADIIAGLSNAYTTLSDDPSLRVGLLYGIGANFTGGLDLAAVGPRLAAGDDGLLPENGRDPWAMYREPATKPIVCAVHGRCFTAGLELVLNSDVCVAAEDAVFGQQEVSRGIVALGGATVRFPQRVGWGNAMRYLLTGDQFSASEALRLGLIQEVVPPGSQFERALEIVGRIADQAPLAVQATLAQARAAIDTPAADAAARLRKVAPALMTTADAREGIAAMVERRSPVFTGA